MSFIHTMIFTCRKATELVEKQRVSGLGLTESVRLRIHMSMCKACATYARQSEMMDDVLKKLSREGISVDDLHLSEEEKEQIRRVILNQSNP